MGKRGYFCHDIGRRPVGIKFLLHEVHIWSHMVKELIVASAQIVQARLSVGGLTESVFGTFPVTRKRIAAGPALHRKPLNFLSSEIHLARTEHHLNKGFLVNIAEFTLREHEMVTTIYIAIPFHCAGMTAAFGQ